jgi:hypothetical protein
VSRRRLFRIGAVVVTAALLASACAASAGAEEFGRCVKVAAGTGAYANSGCTEAGATKGYEWLSGPGAKTGFQDTLSGAAPFKWKLASNSEGICTGEHATGEYTGPKTVGHVQMVFTGCAWGSPLGRTACGSITIAPLRGELGVYAEGATAAQNKLGVKLSTESGELLTETMCGELAPNRWRGSVIAPLTANKMLQRESLPFKQKHVPCGEEQIPAAFVGETPDPLEATHNCMIAEEFGPLGWQMATQLVGEEKVEANSVL